MKALILATAALASTVLATSAFAQSDRACLRNNQIWSTSVVDDNTLIVNNRAGNSFVVRLSGGCQGLTSTLGRVNFNTRTNLGCLGRGDRVAFRHRTVGRNTCFVRDVNTDFGSIARIGRPFTRVN